MSQSADIANGLKSFFKSRNLTQRRIAEILCVTQPCISRILNGLDSIGSGIAVRMSDSFGLSLYWLLTGDGSMLKDNAAVDDPLADCNVSGATHPTPGAAGRHKAVGVISASGDGDASLFESIIAEKDKEILRLRVENERLKRLLSK